MPAMFDSLLRHLRLRRADEAPHATTGPLAAWRARAAAVAESGSAEEVGRELLALADLAADEEETEVEVERLHGRLAELALAAQLAAGDPPHVVTQHRALAGERCHFLAPAVYHATDGDVPGKLFVTERAVRFVGGAGQTLRWSSIAALAAIDRELVVTLVGGAGERRFACNSYGDARVAARLASHLQGKSTGAPGT